MAMCVGMASLLQQGTRQITGDRQVAQRDPGIDYRSVTRSTFHHSSHCAAALAGCIYQGHGRRYAIQGMAHDTKERCRHVGKASQSRWRCLQVWEACCGQEQGRAEGGG